jgi:hypothetical protein
MKTNRLKLFLRSALAASVLAAALTLSAHDHDTPAAGAAKAPAGVLVPVDAKTDAHWLAQARAAYPLDQCPVCHDKLAVGAGAKSAEYIYRQAGQPDRLLRFCDCDDCEVNFQKDPDKYLKALAEATAAKAAAGKKAGG